MAFPYLWDIAYLERNIQRSVMGDLCRNNRDNHSDIAFCVPWMLQSKEEVTLILF
jgi:hypothetical protein